MSKAPIHDRSHRMFRWLLVQLEIEIVSANGALIPLIRTDTLKFLNEATALHDFAGGVIVCQTNALHALSHSFLVKS